MKAKKEPAMDTRRNQVEMVFCGGLLKRHEMPRKDEAALKALLASPRARLVPVWRGKTLFADESGTRPLYLSAETLADTGGESAITALGTYEEHYYFALELDSDDEPEMLEGAFVDVRKALPGIEAAHAEIAAFARAMAHWRRHHRYCGKCGGENVSREGGHVMACVDPECGNLHFPRTDPAIIVVVTRGESCLLGRQSTWPPNRYSCLAGFVEPGESLENAVAREVYEEAGVSVGNVRYASSQPWPFPSSLMLGFYAEAETGAIALNDGELEDARWYTRGEMAKGIADGSLVLPPPISISHKLIHDWLYHPSAY